MVGRRIAIYMVLGALVAGVLGGAPASAAATDEAGFVRLINAERTSRGLGALAVRADLTDVARRHAAKMAASGEIYHNDSLSSQVKGWKQIGENVGTGPRVADIHQAFMDSAPHRSNILHAAYNQIGVGVASDGEHLYVAEVFVRRTTATRSTSTTVTFTVTRKVAQKAPPVRRAKPPQPERPAPQRAVAFLADLAAFGPQPAEPAVGSVPQEG